MTDDAMSEAASALDAAEAALNNLIWRANNTMYERPSRSMQEAIDQASAALAKIRGK